MKGLDIERIISAIDSLPRSPGEAIDTVRERLAKALCPWLIAERDDAIAARGQWHRAHTAAWQTGEAYRVRCEAVEAALRMLDRECADALESERTIRLAHADRVAELRRSHDANAALRTAMQTTAADLTREREAARAERDGALRDAAAMREAIRAWESRAAVLRAAGIDPDADEVWHQRGEPGCEYQHDPPRLASVRCKCAAWTRAHEITGYPVDSCKATAAEGDAFLAAGRAPIPGTPFHVGDVLMTMTWGPVRLIGPAEQGTVHGKRLTTGETLCLGTLTIGQYRVATQDEIDAAVRERATVDPEVAAHARRER